MRKDLVFLTSYQYSEYIISSFNAGGESYNCSLVENHIEQLESFCESNFAKNVTCLKRPASSVVHNIEDADVIIVISKSSKEECGFLFDLDVIDDIVSLLDCRIDSGERLILIFHGTGKNNKMFRD